MSQNAAADAHSFFRLGVLIGLACLLAAGCAATRRAPVSERAPQARPGAPAQPAAARPLPRQPDARADFYTVKQGDTLYSIALDHGIDYRELAAWNNIDPAKIRVGQQLRMKPPAGAVVTAPLKAAPGTVEARPLASGSSTVQAPGPENIKVQPKAVRVPYSDKVYAQMASLSPEAAAPVQAEPKTGPQQEESKGSDDLDWGWPATGKIVGTFNDSTSKGISIAGQSGQPVLASAGGKIIFSGTGIRGFGKLIVIKHNKTYLSVYAHNSELLVKEGQTVAKGQKIAEMGNTDADRVALYFEIRRFGKPLDPAKLLPGQPVSSR
jgi:lipoprotein NlpD